MPILDVEVVLAPAELLPPGTARSLANRAGEVLGTPPGRTWVKLRRLSREDYAENGGPLPAELAPVFVELLEAAPPAGEELERRVADLAEALAEVLGRPASQVHVLVLPPAAGRVAFGGRLRAR